MILQYFGTTWNEIERRIPELAERGYDSLWLPPPFKAGAGTYSVGFDTLDRFDLGDRDQIGTVRTKYGTKADLVSLVRAAHHFGLRVYFDNVMAHNAGPLDSVWRSFQLSLGLASLPANGTPLVMRFYDTTPRASSMASNAVANTDGTWNWNSSALQIEMGVGNDPGTVWQDGAASAFRTTIPIPEPSGILMLGSAAAGWCLRRRRSDCGSRYSQSLSRFLIPIGRRILPHDR